MTSEFAKDDALRSLEVAKRAVAQGDVEKAKKFALKAQKLCDCAEVAAFLKQLSTQTPTGRSASGPSLRQRPSRPTSQGTPEQRALVEKVRRAKDFYETLDLPKDATEDDIKRAYKKLALKLHPDKNKAPGAEEAFKSVSRAFSCLNDSEKRRNYDTYGTEERVQTGRHPNRQDFYTDDFDPEEIFNMFFGGGFPMHNGYGVRTHFYGPQFRRRPRARAESAQPTSTTHNQLINLFSLLPLVLFIFLSIFNGGQDQVYSLYKEYPYDQEIRTKQHGVAFYVQSRAKFSQMYPPGSHKRQILEDHVESVVKRYLEDRCREETRTKRRIKHSRGQEAADRYQVKSCLELRETFYMDRTIKAH